MGTWGCGSLENDDAVNWLNELAAEFDVEMVRSALCAVADAPKDSYVEAPECQMAIAGAEVIAAAVGKPLPDLPEGVLNWVSSGGALGLMALKELAVRAVLRVTKSSELQELWQESKQFGKWLKEIGSIVSRLS